MNKIAILSLALVMTAHAGDAVEVVDQTAAQAAATVDESSESTTAAQDSVKQKADNSTTTADEDTTAIAAKNTAVADTNAKSEAKKNIAKDSSTKANKVMADQNVTSRKITSSENLQK